MYVSNSGNYKSITVGDNVIVQIPNYLNYSSSDSGFTISGTSFTESSDGESDQQGGDDSINGTDIDDSSSSDSVSVSDQLELLSYQVDNLNNNIVTMQEDNKFLIGFVFCITFFIGLKMLYNIFSKVLGLGTC